MSRGELALYTIKSDYAYGATGSPPKIPGGATLIFEIEVSCLRFAQLCFVSSSSKHRI